MAFGFTETPGAGLLLAMPFSGVLAIGELLFSAARAPVCHCPQPGNASGAIKIHHYAAPNRGLLYWGCHVS